jgi:hypothetical protein
MSSADPFDLRPPRRPLRIAILIAAIACLGLTMCVRADQKPAPAKPVPAQAAPQDPPAQQQQQQAPAKPEREPRYFNATKAPGHMY